MSAETDFGATYGLKSAYYKSRASNVASTGAIRLANAETGVVWRNAANNADIPLTVDSSNQLTFNGTALQTNSLTSAHLFIGNSSNVATDRAVNGDISIDNSGTVAISAGVIVNADVNASAAIAITKLAIGTANQIIGTNSGATANEFKTLAGTVNQISITHGTGSITFSTPQDIGTGANPTFNSLTLTTPLTVPNGGTGKASLTAYSLMCGGTTSTALMQQVSGVGSSGQVLTSNGAASLPTWQNAAGTGTVNSGTAHRLALYPASTNVVGDVDIQNSQNIIVVLATQASRSTGLTVTIPNPGNAVSSANALLDSDSGTYTIAGTWTHSIALAISPTSNQLVLGATRTVTLTAPTPATTSRTVTLPDLSADYSVVGTQGTQTIAGAKTFSSALTVSASSGNVLVIDSDTLIVDGTNNRVGIGTTSPGVKLDVTESVSGDGATHGRVVNSGTGYAILQARNSANGNYVNINGQGSGVTGSINGLARAGVGTIEGGSGNFLLTAADGDLYITCQTSAKTIKFRPNAATSDVLTLGSGIVANANISFTATSTQGIVGTTTNDSAAVGNVGQVTSSAVGSTVFPTTTQYGDLTSISLTAGDWLVVGAMNYIANGATATTFNLGISTTSGNSLTGLTSGDNLFTNGIGGSILATLPNGAISVPNYRVSLSGTTTVYLKFRSTYTGTAPTAEGRISAVRIR